MPRFRGDLVGRVKFSLFNTYILNVQNFDFVEHFVKFGN